MYISEIGPSQSKVNSPHNVGKISFETNFFKIYFTAQYSAIVEVETCLFVDLLLNNDSCIVAYFEVVAQQHVYICKENVEPFSLRVILRTFSLHYFRSFPIAGCTCIHVYALSK